MTAHRLTLGLLAVVTGLTLCAAPAAADTIIDGIRIHGGTAGTIPGGATNEIFGAPEAAGQWAGWYGAQLYLAANGPVTYTLIGGEAGYENYFYEGAPTQNLVFTENAMVGYGTTHVSTDASLGDLLSFSFQSSHAGVNVQNGSNPDDSSHTVGPNFFVVHLTTSITRDWGGVHYTLGPGLYLALDDGGAGPDDNHDDMVIRISAVPEPTSLALLGLGLAGLAATRRRRRR